MEGTNIGVPSIVPEEKVKATTQDMSTQTKTSLYPIHLHDLRTCECGACGTKRCELSLKTVEKAGCYRL